MFLPVELLEALVWLSVNGYEVEVDTFSYGYIVHTFSISRPGENLPFGFIYIRFQVDGSNEEYLTNDTVVKNSLQAQGMSISERFYDEALDSWLWEAYL